MAITSGSNRAASMKTYGRRVNSTTTESASVKPTDKRKREQDEKEVVDLPPTKIFKNSSIQSYFKPVVTSSSPVPKRSSALISSDSLHPTSTPPSSPPQEPTSPPIASRRPLKRQKRRLTTKPRPPAVVTMSDSSTSAPIPITSVRTATPARIYQTQLRTDGEDASRYYCLLCDLAYNLSIADDVRAHQDLHQRIETCGSRGVNFSPVDIGPFYYWTDGNASVRTIRVDAKSPSNVRSLTSRVLERVNEELGYAKDTRIGNYVVFIALLGRLPVAAIVTEGPTLAGAYLRSEKNVPGKLLIDQGVSQDVADQRPVAMCVDRIWVHQAFRQKKIATRLLNNALLHSGIQRFDVAFSAPTDQGYKFACRYFGTTFDQFYPNRNIKLLVSLDG